MEKFDILGTLQEAAEDNGFVYLMGDDYHQNYEASEVKYTEGQYVLGADFISSEVYSEYGDLKEINYVGSLRFGRKFDDTNKTHSSLDETHRQKYSRRLLELKQSLSLFLQNFACENRLSITSVVGAHEMNKFDTNIDFVVVQITFNQNTFDIVTIPQYILGISMNTGGTVTPAVGSYTYDSGTIVPMYAEPLTGYRFVSWLIDGIANLSQLIYVKMNTNINAIASFIAQFTLTIPESDNGSTDPAPGDHVYDDGQSVIITATPIENFEFVKFTEDGVDKFTNPLTVVMNAAKVVAAYFQAILQNFTVTITKTGNGTVTPDVGEHIYQEGTEVTITATETDSNYYLDSIYEGEIQRSNPYVFNISDNRAFEARFLAYPSILFDGNTKGWYVLDTNTITKNGANLVSRWNDRLGSGRDLLQATGIKQPVYSANGITFDGVDDFMQAAFTLNQPESLYIVLEQITTTPNDRMFDGKNNFTALISQVFFVEHLYLYGGSTDMFQPKISGGGKAQLINKTTVLKIELNGDNSNFRINGSKTEIKNIGTANMGGLTLGAAGGGTNAGNVRFKEVIVRSISDTIDNKNIIYNYLKNKYKTLTTYILGDSTVSYANNGTDWQAIRTFMDINTMFIDCSYPGGRISQMKTAFNSIIGEDIDFTIIQVGVNDVQVMNAVEIISAYQDLINTIRTAIGVDKKIIISTMIPSFLYYKDSYIALNEAIRGNGLTPITGADGFVDTVATALNAGDGTIAAMYDYGDGLHENNLGRELIAGLWDAKLTELM